MGNLPDMFLITNPVLPATGHFQLSVKTVNPLLCQAYLAHAPKPVQLGFEDYTPKWFPGEDTS